MRKIALSAEAKRDIKSIARYTVAQWGKEQADKYLKELRRQIKLIHQMPTVGVDCSEELQRPFFSFLVGSHVIYYMYDAQRVNIIGILHQTMSPQKNLRLRSE